MTLLPSLIAFTHAAGLLPLTPGVDTLMVLRTATAEGPRRAASAMFGIVTGCLVWGGLVAFGVAAMLAAAPMLFLGIKWAGAAYLVWIGLQTFLGSHPSLSVGGGPKTGSRLGIFRAGLVMKLADPKTLFYFVALLPQFIDPSGDVGLQVAILAVTSVVIELCVLLAYGGLAGRLGRFARNPRFARWTDRIAGTFLIAAGLGMAAIRESE